MGVGKSSLMSRYIKNEFPESPLPTIAIEFATKIIRNRTDLTTADMKNVIVFLNGEYFGTYIMMEKFTDDFIESHYNIPKNNVSMNSQGKAEEGPEEELKKFMSIGREYSKKDLREKKIMMKYLIILI